MSIEIDEESIDKMLDDLKTTVNPDTDRPSSRRDNSLVSSFSCNRQDIPDQTFLDIFRSTSRSESRNSNRSGVEDGGLMKHHHKEYTSPDKTTRVVSDQFEYESGDPNKYQKKVMKSTYSNYKVSGNISSDLDTLQQGPDQSVMDAASRTTLDHTDNTKVVSASQKVANRLVDALSTIGPDGQPLPIIDINSGTMINSDTSTLGRLNKNIRELDTLIEGMDQDSRAGVTGYSAKIITEKRTVLDKDLTSTKEINTKAEKSKSTESLEELPSKANLSTKINILTSSDFDETKKTRDENTTKSSSNVSTAEGPTSSYSTSSYTSNKTNKYSTTGMTNGKPGYDEEDDLAYINEPSGGEVKKIVWRNRFEKTYETQDGTPTISIEEEARRKRERERQYYKTTPSTLTNYQPQPPQRGPVSPRQLQLQYAVYWPNFSPNVSPGGQSWADPIPMPTPPQVSPKGEPGVAYVYTYGQGGGSQVQHLPPLNYVTSSAPPATSIPPSEGAPSPTPSSGTQPIIYHYSYHYTLQPGQSIPEGVPQPPGGHPSQPALQMTTSRDGVPPPPRKPDTQPASMSYDYKKSTSHATSSSTVDRSDVNNIHHHHIYPPSGGSSVPPLSEPRFPNDSQDDTQPRSNDPDHPRNISITINKSSRHVTTTKDYTHGGPTTSTPFPTPGRRSRSSSPDRYPRSGPSGPYGTVTHVTRTSYSDSLDRLRKPPHEGLPFPDTSPIKPKDDSKIPKRVDDLMTSLSDSEDGPTKIVHINTRGPGNPRAQSLEREPLIGTKISSENAEMSLAERNAMEIKKEETKNVAGPPVYYPPGHHQLFDESMHTMTLKENKRRGMAKWRMEKASGYKESSSSSESKGGMAMVPVCLPLCCGAACAIM